MHVLAWHVSIAGVIKEQIASQSIVKKAASIGKWEFLDEGVWNDLDAASCGIKGWVACLGEPDVSLASSNARLPG
jgi:hypothetical protein